MILHRGPASLCLETPFSICGISAWRPLLVPEATVTGSLHFPLAVALPAAVGAPGDSDGDDDDKADD